jgi:hypothetical protein
MSICELCGQSLPEPPVRHWQIFNPAGPACGQQTGVVTVDPGRVDCDACKNTSAWKGPR